MFPQNSRLLNLFRLKNDTKFNLEMLQFYYSHETPNRETSEKSTKLKRFSRRFLFGSSPHAFAQRILFLLSRVSLVLGGFRSL